MMKPYTDIEQSKKLKEILPSTTMDLAWNIFRDSSTRILRIDDWEVSENAKSNVEIIPAWSLAALLKCLSEIKPQEYTPILFPSEGKWVLQFVEYGKGNVCEVSCDNPIDSCVEIILKLHELKIL